MNIPIENPYVGPRTFLESDSACFFGRDREARDLLALVISEPLVLFYAQSGAGKSSLVNTRLIPELKKRRFKILTGRFGGDVSSGVNVENIFIFNLVQSLAPEGTQLASLAKVSLKDFLSDFKNSPSKESQEAETRPSQPSVLILDQFEEIFRTHHEAWDRREDFFKQLADAMEMDPYLWVVLVMREDFIASLDPYVHLLPGRLRMRYYMQRLERAAALDAIKKPVKDLRPFEDGVAEKLVDDLRGVKVYRPDGTPDIQPGQFVEPVQLQVVCSNLWQNLPPGGSHISEKDLQDVGDVDLSLGNYYAERVKGVAEAQNVKERKIREWFSNKLISPSGVRTPVLREQNGKSGGLDDRIVQALHDLVRAEQRGGATFYELTHDRLVAPILANNRRWEEQNFSPLQRQAVLWNSQGQNESWLLSDQALLDVEQWAEENPDEVTQIEEQFLEASRKLQNDREEKQKRELESRRARQRRVITGASVIFSVITLGLAAFGLFQSSLAVDQAATAQAANTLAATALVAANTAEVDAQNQAAIARSRELATIAMDQMDTNPQLAILLTIQAFQTDRNQQSWSTLLTATQKFSSIQGYLRPPHLPDEVQVSPDGRLIASRDKNGILLWDQETLQPLNPTPINGHFGSVYALKFNREGTILASGGLDGSIVLWDTTNHEPIGDVLQGHTGGVWSIAFSPDGKTMASGSIDSTIILWDLENLAQIKQKGEPLRGHTSEIVSIDISRDGRILASGSSDGTIRLWDLRTGESSGQLTPSSQGSGIWALAFSPDGRILASGSSDGSLIFWDIDDLEPVGNELIEHTSSIRCMAFSPDGTTLATGGYDNSVVLWNVEKQEFITRFSTHFQESIFSLSFTPDSKVMAAASYDGMITLFDTENHGMIGKPFSNQKNAIFSISFSPVENILASGSVDSTIQLWDLSDPALPKKVGPLLRGHPGQPTGMTFSPNGNTLLSYGEDGTVVYNLDSGKLTEPLDYKALSKAGDILAHQIRDNDTGQSFIRLMDTTTGDPIGEPIPGAYLLLTDNGKFVVSLLEEEENGGSLVGIWDAQTSAKVGELTLSDFSSVVGTNGRTLVTMAYNGTAERDEVLLWDIGSGMQVREPIPGYQSAASADGEILAISSYDDTNGENMTQVWDLEARQRIGEPIQGILSALSQHGSMLVTGRNDPNTGRNTITIWEIGNSLRDIDTLDGEFLTISPDERLLLYNLFDEETAEYKIGVWDFEEQATIGRSITGTYSSISPDSRVVTTINYNDNTGEEESTLWDSHTGTRLGNFPGSSYLTISPDSRFVLLRSIGNLVSVRSILTSSLGESVETASTVQSAATSPDNQIFAYSVDNKIFLQNRNEEGTVSTFTIPGASKIESMSFRDNKLLTACDQTNTTTLINLEVQKPVSPPVAGCDPIFSPDGKYLAVSNAEKGETDLWNLNPLSIAATLPGLQASFSDDSRNMLVVEPLKSTSDSGGGGSPINTPTARPPSEDVPQPSGTSTPSSNSSDRQKNNLAIWDISQTKPQNITVKEIPCSTTEDICTTAIFDPTERNRIIYSDDKGNIYVWRIIDPLLPAEPEITIGAGVNKLHVIRMVNEPYLIVEDVNGFSSLWDMKSFTQVGEPIPGRFQLSGSNPDVSILLYIDNNGNLFSWDLTPSRWISQLCKSAGRNINEKERDQYFSERPYPVTCPQWPIMPGEPTASLQ